MSFRNHMLLWNHAAIRRLELQDIWLQPEEELQYTRLSTSTFVYIVSGQGELELDGTLHFVHGGFIGHLGRGHSLGIKAAQGQGELSGLIISYKATIMRPCDQELLDLYRESNPFQMLFGLAYKSKSSTAWEEQLNQIRRLSCSDSQIDRFGMKAHFYALVYDWLALLDQHARQSGCVGQGALQTVLQHIKAHYQEELVLEDLAELVQCSPRQLQRLFKSELAIRPKAYLIQVRMEHASRLLLHTKATIKQIAEQVGYGDVYYFSRAFKKFSGVAPAQFREGEGRIMPENEAAIVSTSTPSQHIDHSYLVKNDRDEYTIHIHHLMGELQLLDKPQRIAVLDIQYVDHLVTLGEHPAGSVRAEGEHDDFPDYLANRLPFVSILGTYGRPDIAAIQELQPDFIICTEFHQGIYQMLEQIAPTMMLLRNEDWRNTLVTLGQIMGKAHIASQIIRDYKRKTQRLSRQLAARLNGQSVALIRPRNELIRIHTSQHRTGAILYEDLGLQQPLPTTAWEDSAYNLTVDRLPELSTADHCFLLSSEQFRGEVQQVRSAPAWQELKAVKNDRVYAVDTATWIGYYGPLTINRLVSQIARTLLA